MAPASASQIGKWKREFDEIGADRVRSGLIVGGWEREKRRVAQQWLDQADTVRWAAERPPESDQGTFFLNLRNAKWWGIIIGTLLFGFALVRLWRRW